ncbi:major facilitator superfamily domain-containing protein, partial [Zychaea mexicana]|uniref:major facilitator superfamily domain-containing protein n=1 Tax=Zychaea mexicana TaxID=64656 RepID=UPI0022FE5564
MTIYGSIRSGSDPQSNKNIKSSSSSSSSRSSRSNSIGAIDGHPREAQKKEADEITTIIQHSKKGSSSSSSTNNGSESSNIGDNYEDDDYEGNQRYKSRLDTLSLTTLTVCLCTSGFFPALDTTVVFTTLNDIGTEFQCSNIAAWVHTSYLLVTVMVQLLYSKLSTVFGRQPMLVCVTAFFLIGNVGCSYATTFSQLIVSRVIAGMGGGGTTVMIITVLHDLLPARKRGVHQSYVATAQTLGMAFGPPVGGFLTENFGWRYCFKISIIPLLIVLYIYTFRLPNYSPVEDDETSTKSKRLSSSTIASTATSEPSTSSSIAFTTSKGNSNDRCISSSVFKKLYAIDFLGAILLGTANTTFATGLTLGGNTRSWTDLFIISMLAMSIIFYLIFGIYEMFGAAHPLVSRLIVSNRNTMSICIASHLWGLGTSVSFYVLPQLFMGVLGLNPAQSGLWTMIESASISAGNMLAGQYLKRMPRTRTFILTATTVYTVATGAMSMWPSPGFPFTLGIVCIIIEGLMSGAFVMTTIMAVSANIPRQDVSIVSSVAVMCRLMGYLNGVAVASAILQSTLKVFLYDHVKGDDAETIIVFIRTSIRKVHTLPLDIQQMVAEGLGRAIQRTFWFAIACTTMTFIVMLFMKDHPLWNTEQKISNNRK